MEKNPDLLSTKADEYAHAVYALCRRLPEEEKFGLISQLRRSALSVPLNIVEGYARNSIKSETQFLLIAFGSLKESQYTISFAVTDGYISNYDVANTLELGEEISRLLWTKIRRFRARAAIP